MLTEPVVRQGGQAVHYSFIPDTVDYFRRGRRSMIRPPLESIPTIVPGALVGRLISSRTDLDLHSGYGSDITLTPGLGGRLFVHSLYKKSHNVDAGPSGWRVL